ncbi:MAG: 30S ribosomal protein S6 [Marinilabiliales bacterium]|mgnify:CR=1 FL=1|nr:MAG: 30S ribosomal protein S6 [Marinilabiliales bacterium]
MANRYETVFIMTPVLSDDQTKETVNKFKDFIVSNGGEIKHEEDWGMKKLAYPIQKKTTGFYHLIEFESDGQVIGNLETQFKRDERIIRFLTVGLDKYGVAYVEKRRRLKAEKEQENKTPKED